MLPLRGLFLQLLLWLDSLHRKNFTMTVAFKDVLKGLLQSLKNNKKKSAAAAAGTSVAIVIGLASPMIEKSEGLRTAAYIDPVGVPTICFGETLGVNMGDVKTESECRKMLRPRLEGFLSEIRRCTKYPGGSLPPKTEAAFLSFAYNVGSPTYCKNIAEKRINVGKLREACEALLLYTKAGRPLRVLPGLVRRRQEERNLCIEGLNGGAL